MKEFTFSDIDITVEADSVEDAWRKLCDLLMEKTDGFSHATNITVDVYDVEKDSEEAILFDTDSLEHQNIVKGNDEKAN